MVPASPVQPAGPSKTHRSRTYIVHGGDVAASAAAAAAARCMSRDSRSPSFDMYVVCVEENEGGTTFRDPPPPPPLLLLPPSHAVQVAVENLHSTAAPTSLWTMVGLGWRSRYGSWAGGGTYSSADGGTGLDLSGGGSQETDGRQCGRHARTTQQERYRILKSSSSG